MDSLDSLVIQAVLVNRASLVFLVHQDKRVTLDFQGLDSQDLQELKVFQVSQVSQEPQEDLADQG